MPRPQSRCVHGGFTADFAVIGQDVRDAASLLAKTRDRHALDNLHAACPCTFCVSHRQRIGVDVAIRGNPDRPAHAFQIDQRILLSDVAGSDQLDLEAHALAAAAFRLSSSQRASLLASRIEPTPWKLTSWPVSAPMLAHSFAEYCISLVRLRRDRSCPTSPAACHVLPAVSAVFSSSRTSRWPSFARWYAIEQPIAPPPMMTMRAASGSLLTRSPQPASSARAGRQALRDTSRRSAAHWFRECANRVPARSAARGCRPGSPRRCSSPAPTCAARTAAVFRGCSLCSPPHPCARTRTHRPVTSWHRVA